VATILIADDNSNIQKMVTLALKDQGIDVISVGNGEAAVRKLPDLRPDLVLADIFMPVRNGYEVCEFVKQDARFAHIPVILLVGAFDPLDEREAKRVGADGVLKKPFVPPDPLISMVKSVLAKSARQHLTPVAVPVEKQAPVEASAEAAAELPPEEFAVQPERVAFGEGEKPLAFGELLQTPVAEPEAEVTPSHDAGLGEMGLWQNLPSIGEPAPEPESFARSGSETVLPGEDEAALPGPVEISAAEPSEIASEEETTPQVELGPLPELASSAAEWMETALAHPPTALVPEASETWDNTTPVQAEPLPSLPATEGHEVSEEPVEQATAPFAVASSSTAAPPEEPLPAVEAEPASSTAVGSFEVPQPPDPELVEAVVAKVLERMQPQILEIVTREILRPVVEALVRRELEKR
jgi:CheY-like chemotaxis protein